MTPGRIVAASGATNGDLKKGKENLDYEPETLCKYQF